MKNLADTSLAEQLNNEPFHGYAYSYPHKTAYRPFDPPIPLKPLWQNEDRQSLFFYLHLPFCEMRCGFCNLFTTTNPESNLLSSYLESIDRQMGAMADILGDCRFGQVAFGGGTPSFLSETELDHLFARIALHFGGFANDTPFSFETSPGTISSGKLALLREHGVTRLSIGVQSFLEEETKKLGRPQKPEILHQALQTIAAAKFPVTNLDLIYGIEGQTAASWQSSLEQALEYHPEELYLYPLYVRPLTGLGRKHRETSQHRLALYRQAREHLLENGYEQISMRLFRHASTPHLSADGPVYCCQEDGMIGIGAGARSYTRDVHYSSEYAVGRKGILQILEDFVQRPTESFQVADYGCRLSLEEQKRRFLIKSLLRREGLIFDDYESEFGESAHQDFRLEITELIENEVGEEMPTRLVLTPKGFENSDAIGPWLFSASIKREMEEFELV